MNNKQRISIVISGIVLAVALITTPKYQMYEGKRFPANEVSNFENKYDFEAALIRGVAVLGLSVSAYFVMKSKNDMEK
jgi:hypothetical protein